MYKIIHKPQARVDAQGIYDHYENCREGLGDEFIDEFETTIEKYLTKTPKIFQIITKNIRRTTLNKFSEHSIFYVVNETKQEVQILAVMHNKRCPEHWKRRNKN